MTTVREQLVAARDLIADPERWTWGAYARDADGQPVFAYDSKAVAWCARGAALKVGVPPGTLDPVMSIYTNDHEGHAAVLAMFDRAIEAAS